MAAHTTSLISMEKKLVKNIMSQILIPEMLLYLHIHGYDRESNPVLNFIRNAYWSIRNAGFNSHFTNIKDRVAKAHVSGLNLLLLV